MAYIGFDLDETLGYFGFVDIYTKFLDPYQLVLSPPSPTLDAKLQTAFDAFARCLVAQPNTANILRPGMLQLFQRLAQLKDEGRIRAIAIYSNNGNPSVLRLAQRMLELGIRVDNLFCAKVHATHPLRSANRQPGLPPNAAPKTLITLKRIFQQCQGINESSPIDNRNIFFFDDIVHRNIQYGIGGNYKVVAPFKIAQSAETITSCFQHAMETSGLATDPEYFEYIGRLEAISSALAGSPTPFEALQRLAIGFLLPPSHGYVVWNDDMDSIRQFIEEKIASGAGANRGEGTRNTIGGKRRKGSLRSKRKTRRLFNKNRQTKRRRYRV
jgi:hypothetical protein